MTNTDKSLEMTPSPKLYRAKQVLENKETAPKVAAPKVAAPIAEDNLKPPKVTKGETGGPKGPDPTRYGDWERNGRCIDF
jgi:hypothetical protein